MEPVEFKEGESQIFIFEIEEPQNQELTVLKEQVSELENQIKLISDTKNLNETVTKLQEKIQEMSLQIIKALLEYIAMEDSRMKNIITVLAKNQIQMYLGYADNYAKSQNLSQEEALLKLIEK
jgi:hypothetical protein